MCVVLVSEIIGSLEGHRSGKYTQGLRINSYPKNAHPRYWLGIPAGFNSGFGGFVWVSSVGVPAQLKNLENEQVSL